MPKIAIALFFVLPLFAQLQQSDYCFANEKDALKKLNDINNYCSKTYGSGAGFEGIIVSIVQQPYVKAVLVQKLPIF